MSFIEGVGDEVTAFAVILLVLILSAVVTFLLNSTPFSENRQIHQTVPIETNSVNDSPEQAVNEERNYDQEEIDIASSNNVNSSNNNDCEEVCSNANINESASIDNDEQVSEDTVHTQIYPDVNNCHRPSAPEYEETAETEESSGTETEGIRVRLKYLDDTERTVVSNPTAKISDFKRAHFAEDFANNKIVRLIFSGQLLRDNCTLQSYGIANNCVVHVQILQAQTQQDPSSAGQNADLDLSHLLWPLLSVILGICWILYFKYPEFFNAMSLGVLFLFSGSFVYFYSQVEHR